MSFMAGDNYCARFTVWNQSFINQTEQTNRKQADEIYVSG